MPVKNPCLRLNLEFFARVVEKVFHRVVVSINRRSEMLKDYRYLIMQRPPRNILPRLAESCVVSNQIKDQKPQKKSVDCLKRFLLITIAFSLAWSGLTWAYDIGIRNVTIYEVDKETFSSNQEVLVTGKTISKIQSQPRAPTPVKKVIDGSNLVLLPGFINTHTHLWQHVAKSIAPDAQLQDWVKLVYRYAHYLKPDEIVWVTLIAAKQAQLSGITTVSDFASVNFQSDAVESTLKALNQAKMGGYVVWWNPAVFLPADLRRGKLQSIRSRSAPLDVIMGFGPLSFFNLPAIYDGILIAKASGMRMSEHTMENVAEARDFQKNIVNYYNTYSSRLNQDDAKKLKEIIDIPPLSAVDSMVSLRRQAGQVLSRYSGRENKLTEDEKKTLQNLALGKIPTEIPLLEHLGALNNFVAIHSVWLNREDFDIYVKNEVKVSHNPESNMYLSSGVAPLLDYTEKNIPISIATDGAASNDRIDYITAMRETVNLQKAYVLDPDATKVLSAKRVLRSATLTGAEALGLEKITGSITVGKDADLVLLSKAALGLSPYVKDFNDVAILINGADKRAVDTVISDGVVVVEKGKLANWNEANLARRLSDIVQNLIDRQLNGMKREINITIGSLKEKYGYYSSVRKADTLNFTVRNDTTQGKELKVVFSTSAFGGTAAAMLSDEAKKRFPFEDDLVTEVSGRLNAGETLLVTKAKDSNSYKVQFGRANPSLVEKGVLQIALLPNP